MTTRPLDRPGTRLLNHVELVYAPGERALVRRFFEALGLRVLDPQVDPVPPELGPAAGPYLIVYLDDAVDDLIDNVVYASEVKAEQWALESALRRRIGEDDELRSLHDDLRAVYARLPQAMTHVGIAYASTREVRDAMAQLVAIPELAERLTLSEVFEPGDLGSVDDRVTQAFVYTDLVSVGLLLGGQQIELQVRLDGA
jgi:hypothetical protein